MGSLGMGDVTMEGPGKAFAMLSQLKGIKYLIRGNHDCFVDNEVWNQYSWVFRWVKDYHELVWNNQKFVLFHYPIAEWAGYFKGSIHLHGHQHNMPAYNRQQAEAGLRRYDVGVDAHGFKPISVEAIAAFYEG